MKADLNYLGNLKLASPVSLVAGDTISVMYKENQYAPYKELIKRAIDDTYYFEEVAVFDGTIESGRRVLGGMLIEGE